MTEHQNAIQVEYKIGRSDGGATYGFLMVFWCLDQKASQGGPKDLFLHPRASNLTRKWLKMMPEI